MYPIGYRHYAFLGPMRQLNLGVGSALNPHRTRDGQEQRRRARQRRRTFEAIKEGRFRRRVQAQYKKRAG